MGYHSTILIVDDEPVGREILGTLLGGTSDGDYDLAFASNGMEALERAAELTPDLILLDVMMPGMSGFEVCQRLRADSVLGEVPVIMLTALDDRDSRLQGLEAEVCVAADLVGDDEHGPRVLPHQHAGCLQAVHAGHDDIHEHDVGIGRGDAVQRFPPPRGLADDPNRGVLLCEPPKRDPAHRRVIDDEGSHRVE